MSVTTKRTVSVSVETVIQSAWCDCQYPNVRLGGKGHELYLCEMCGLIYENRLTGMHRDMVYGTFPTARASNTDTRDS